MRKVSEHLRALDVKKITASSFIFAASRKMIGIRKTQSVALGGIGTASIVPREVQVRKTRLVTCEDKWRHGRLGM